MTDTTKSNLLETEAVIYAKINNFEGFKQADYKENQVQLETKFANGTNCRTRHSSNEEKNEFKFTFKAKVNSDSGIQVCKEHNIPITEEFFDDFKNIVDRVFYKVRYSFNSKEVELTFENNGEKITATIPNIKYEVDVYLDKDNNPNQWCKIDIEVDSVIDFLDTNYPELDSIKLHIKVSHLPFEPSDCILMSIATDEQKEFVNQLFKTFNQK